MQEASVIHKLFIIAITLFLAHSHLLDSKAVKMQRNDQRAWLQSVEQHFFVWLHAKNCNIKQYRTFHCRGGIGVGLVSTKYDQRKAQFKT